MAQTVLTKSYAHDTLIEQQYYEIRTHNDDGTIGLGASYAYIEDAKREIDRYNAEQWALYHTKPERFLIVKVSRLKGFIPTTKQFLTLPPLK